MAISDPARRNHEELLPNHQSTLTSDGAVARSQIAEVLVRSLASEAAERKTFELVAERGPAPDDLDALFAPLDADPHGALDAARDTDNMPLEKEPARIREDIAAALGHRSADD
jgi:hypothetical protein